MAIFSRRDIQTVINRLSCKLTRQQLDVAVNRLNSTAIQSIAAQWEVVVLSAFQACGRIIHEGDLGGRTRPDILFRLGQSGNLEFLTDVATVSDKNTREENPYEDFRDAIDRFLFERGHIAAGLDIQVEHTEEGEYTKRKIRLALPRKEEMDGFIGRELGQFLREISGDADRDNHFRYNKDGIRFTIRYNASEKRYASGGHICYTVPHSTRNVLTNALISKGKQLERSGYQGMKGIVICDGGCDALNERSRVNGAYGCQELVEGYLKQHPFILWVLVLRIEQTHGIFAHENTITIKSKLYWSPIGNKQLYRDTRSALGRMVNFLPEPESTPANALNRLNSGNGTTGRPLGKISMQDKTIKISARALTELLAGKIELQKFREDHGFSPHPLDPNGVTFPFFERQLASGNTLQNAFVEKEPQKDDDWIVLEYEGPDPAISPFRVR